jgi:hypothetical protein
MRLPLTRATALVAILAALATAGGFAPTRPGPGGRDRILRLARGGPQRLESPDGPIHCHEETDAVHVPAGDVIDTAALIQDPPGPVADQPVPVAVLASSPIPLLQQQFPTVIRSEVRRLLPPRRSLERHAPDRAPPIV